MLCASVQVHTNLGLSSSRGSHSLFTNRPFDTTASVTATQCRHTFCHVAICATILYDMRLSMPPYLVICRHRCHHTLLTTCHCFDVCCVNNLYVVCLCTKSSSMIALWFVLSLALWLLYDLEFKLSSKILCISALIDVLAVPFHSDWTLNSVAMVTTSSCQW